MKYLYKIYKKRFSDVTILKFRAGSLIDFNGCLQWLTSMVVFNGCLGELAVFLILNT